MSIRLSPNTYEGKFASNRMAMNCLLVDTCVLSDIMRQYNPSSPHATLCMGNYLRKNMLRLVNSVIGDEDEISGFIVTSTFAFLELINKFDEIFKQEIANHSMTLDRLTATLQQPPSWLITEDVNEDTAKTFCEVPISISTGERISSDDAVHIATALQRGDDITFLTTDHILKQLNMKKIKVITD